MQASAKEPWLAVWLSSFICAGIGQIYCGDRKKGVSFIVIDGLLSLVTLAALVCFIQEASAGKLILGIGFGLGTFVFSVYTFFDAYKTAHIKNAELQLQLPPRKKQPFLALFLSSIIPGAGQIYNSQWLKGIGILLSVAIIGGLLESIDTTGPTIALILQIAATLWILHDAYSQAAKMNGESPSLIQRFGQRSTLSVIALWFLIQMLLAGSLVVVIRPYFFSTYMIPVASMAPTLLKGDRIFANKWMYRYENPKRGDLVVFEYSVDRRKDFIKRVAGLPGEKLKIENGHIYVNGELLESPQFPRDRVFSNREDWQYGKVGQMIEIPDNSYFVIGDNTQESSDSRNWGFVPRKYIKAKGYWIWWPIERWQKL